MIGVALALVLQQPALPVVEVIAPEESVVVMSAWVRAPEMGPADQAAWRVLARTLLDGTSEFTRVQLFEYGSQAGVTPRVVMMPDFLRVEFVAPVGGLDVAGLLLESVLLRPSLRNEDIRRAVAELKDDTREPWSRVLWGPEPNWAVVDPSRVRELAQRTLRRESVRWVVGGRFAAGQGRAEVQRRFSSGWPTAPPIRPRFEPRFTPEDRIGRGLALIEWRGSPVSPWTPHSAARALAMHALGAGKGSTAFRVLRETQLWSYQQEAILWPTAQGWVPRVMMVLRAERVTPDLPERVRAAILDDIEHWSEGDRARALAMARSSLEIGNPLGVFWLDSGGPRGASLMDRMGWQGFLQMVGTGPTDERRWFDAMSQVDLETLKTQAVQMVSEMGLRVAS